MYNASHGHVVKLFKGKTTESIEKSINDFLFMFKNLRIISASTVIEDNTPIKYMTTVVFHDVEKND